MYYQHFHEFYAESYKRLIKDGTSRHDAMKQIDLALAAGEIKGNVDAELAETETVKAFRQFQIGEISEKEKEKVCADIKYEYIKKFSKKKIKIQKQM